MNIGLYFGSFNPIHIGHLIVANHVLEHSDLDKIWFVISPQNPLKKSSTLLNEYDRMHLVELAIEDNPKFKASNIEFKLPKPSYTIDTLTYLKEKFPLESFTVIMGSDSYLNLPKWKNYEQLKQQYKIIVYERPEHKIEEQSTENITFLKAPLIAASSTFIRNLIKEKKSARYLLPEKVYQYIIDSNYYNA